MFDMLGKSRNMQVYDFYYVYFIQRGEYHDFYHVYFIQKGVYHVKKGVIL